MPTPLAWPQTVDGRHCADTTQQEGGTEMNEEGQIAGIIVPQADGDDVDGIIVPQADGDGLAMADLDIQPCL